MMFNDIKIMPDADKILLLILFEGAIPTNEFYHSFLRVK
jgi:hypothetical protein